MDRCRLFAVPFLLSLAACAPGSDRVEDQIPEGAIRCQASYQCLPEETCFNGYCAGGEQQNTTEACSRGADCGAGETCRQGLCVEAVDDVQCRANRDCRQGQTCDSGRCVSETEGCQRNSDCPVDDRCERGRCVPLQDDPPQDQCREDRDCPRGESCRSGRCEMVHEDSGAACQTHDQCPEDEICQVRAGAREGRCAQFAGQRCLRDRDCDFRDAQNQGTPGVCEQGQCRIDQFGFCTQDEDCAGTYSCVTAGQNRRCLQPCRDNGVCDSNLLCDGNINACWYNLCGAANEVSQAFEGVNNGELGGRCDADGRGDGTCVEVDAGGGEWVGMCIEGGSVPVGGTCRFGAGRNDDNEQCEGGAWCHFDGDREEGVCVASCAVAGSHGNVGCDGVTDCVAGRCLSRDQRCDPAQADACGAAGRCSLLSWGEDQGMCKLQEPNPQPAGSPCELSTQCVDGAICLTLNQASEAASCHALCRPWGDSQDCPGSSRCTSLLELSQGRITSNFGICVPQ